MGTTNNLYQVLSTLKGIDPQECRGLMSDYDSFINRIESKINIQTFIAHFRNAEKSYLKRNKAGEKRSLLLALDQIKYYNFTDTDLKEEGFRDYITGTILTIKKIKMRLKSIG
jgi:hypothetical protein